ncbi:MAG: hypothetical protein IKL80_01000 [Clostridia bacterium]|nr:hypothetical protein [Clostridia bacterium]
MSKKTKMLKKVMGLMMVVCILAASLAVPAYAAPELTLENTIASHETPGTAAIDMCISDKYAFVAYEYSYQNTVQAGVEDERFVGQTFTAYNAWVEVYDIQTNPTEPTYLTSISMDSDVKYGRYPKLRISDVALKGDYLLVSYYSPKAQSIGIKKISFYDVSNINEGDVLTERTLAHKANYALPGVVEQVSNMVVSDDTLIVMSNTTSGADAILFFDISDETLEAAGSHIKPIEARTVTNAVAVGNVGGTVGRYSVGCLDGNYLYYTNWSLKQLDLFVADISNGEFKVLGSYQLSADANGANNYQMASAICVQGDYVYVTSHRTKDYKITNEAGNEVYEKNALYILDVSKTKAEGTAEAPVAPTLLSKTYPGGTTNTNSQIGGLAVNGSYAYLWGSGTSALNMMQRIHMYDVSDKTAPVRIASIAQTTTPKFENQHAFTLKDNLIYSCASTNGLLVHSVTANEITEPVVTNAADEAASLADTSLAAAATVTNYSASPYNGMLIMARYDGDELLGVETNMFTVPAGTKAREIETEALTAEGGTAAKAMLWKNNIIPVKILELLEQAAAE